ncbi:MAG: 2'-5' RNA ligase [Parcubacteria group bacterium GW2011_GWA2_38_27]|nr:MAG: 2'-5' RNA ligase [Parcubacteria group bacterium GW2011_GWA2_38_27]
MAGYKEKWPGLPARWTNPENLHITLAFIGYASDEELVEACEIAKKVAEKHNPFSVNINKICYGPKNKPAYINENEARQNFLKSSPSFVKALDDRSDDCSFSENKPPRMVWATGKKSKEFSTLKNDLDDLLLESQKIRFSADSKEFSSHITLARIRAWEWLKIEPEERPEIDEDIDMNFFIDSTEVMESELKRGGSKYEIIESFSFES